MQLGWFDIFVLVSGTLGLVAAVPLIYLAVHSHHEGRELRRVQEELARLVAESKEVSEEVRDLQHETRRDQRATLERFDGSVRRRRPRLPRRRNAGRAGEGAQDADRTRGARLARIAQARDRARARIRS